MVKKKAHYLIIPIHTGMLRCTRQKLRLGRLLIQILADSNNYCNVMITDKWLILNTNIVLLC